MTVLPLAIPKSKAITLRPYQRRSHTAIRQVHADSDKGALLVLCTGAGKTVCALAFAVEDYLAQGKRVVWLAMRQELLDQPMEALRETWPEHARSAGIVQADRDTPDAQIVFASVQTVTNEKRLSAILDHGYPDLVIFDEAHHHPSPTAKATTDALISRGAKLLGLTATPDRTDMLNLADDWEIAFSYNITQAIRDGYLVPPYAAVSRLPDLDLSRVSGRRDYDDQELAAELLRAGIIEHTVATMQETLTAVRLPDREGSRFLTAQGRASLVFTPTVELAELTAEALRDAGFRARHLSGKTPKLARGRLISAFKKGRIDVLVNVGVLTEGTDLPRASCIVMARPTKSWSLYVQVCGRGLRLYEGKEDCLILDLAGATEDHSLISAPVLIGGARCPKSPNGGHDLVPCADVQDGAKCSHCGRKVGCGVNLGPHTYDQTHHCTGCKRPQCVESPDAAHCWVPAADHKRRCADCGIEVPDPLAGLVGKRSGKEIIEAEWVRIWGLFPETYAVDVGNHGILFVVGSRKTEQWMPVWLVKGGRRPRPFFDDPVHASEVRGYANDLVTRAEKVAAKGAAWKDKQPRRYDIVKAESFGVYWKNETAGELACAVFKVHARERAIKTGISSPVEE